MLEQTGKKFLNNQSKALLGIVCFLVSFLAIVASASLKAANVSSSYVTPFPSGGTYKVLVLGDGYAESAWLGLKKAFKNNPKIEIFREIDYGAGLISRGRKDWVKRLDNVLSKRSYNIAVIMIGLGDTRRIKIKGKTYKMDTEEWRNNYRKRIREVLRKFSSRKISVYWTGLPIVRSERLGLALKTINQLANRQTAGAEVRFIDNWLHFSSENGQYTQYGPDVEGKIRLLRQKDGVYFTRTGYEKLGFFIHKFIQRDLREARAERNVPLLGGERDQTYLLRRYTLENPSNRRPKSGGITLKGEKALKGKNPTGSLFQRREYETPKHATIKLPAAKSKTGKEVQLRIIRPAIPAAAFSITRRSALGLNSQAQLDETLMSEKQEEIISLSIPSTLSQLTSNRDKRRIPLTQTPYYKLVVRGDAQISKPGRADYFARLQGPDKTQSKPEN